MVDSVFPISLAVNAQTLCIYYHCSGASQSGNALSGNFAALEKYQVILIMWNDCRMNFFPAQF